MKKVALPEFPPNSPKSGDAESANTASHQAQAEHIVALDEKLKGVENELQSLTTQHQALHDEREELICSLLESEERYRLLVLATASIIWATDVKGAFTTTSAAWERFTGQTIEQYRDLGWQEMIHPEDRTAFMASWQVAIESKSLFQVTCWLYSYKHEDYRYLVMRAAPFLNASGEIKGWLGSSFDVTELKDVEAKLRVDTERFNLALKSAQVGAWHWDIAQDVMTWDGHIHPLLGREPGTLESSYQEFLQRVHPDNCAELSQSMQRALEAAAGFETEYRIVWPDGKIHTISTKGETFCNEQGVPLHMSGICWDVTLQKKLEQEHIAALQQAEAHQRLRAQEAEQYKSKLEEFINTICHEIRNPLNGIMGSTEWLQEAQQLLEASLESLEPPTEQVEKIQAALKIVKEVIETNQECACHQLSIVNDVLDLSKLEANQLKLDSVPFKPESIIQSVVKIYRAKLVEKKLAIKLHLPSESLIVKGDPARLKMILINLFVNAIKFTSTGHIGLSLRQAVAGSQVNLQITVKDTGIGMTAEQQTHLFERFTQASTAIYKEYGGTGLGLTISKNLAKLMGGDIQVESEAGKGSKFIVSIQCQQPTEQEKNAYQAKTTPSTLAFVERPRAIPSKKILIVEDNVINQKILRSLLTKQGYRCEIAQDGIEALEHFQKKSYALIFMDTYMPRMDGLKATQRIREHEQIAHLSPTPIVGVSGQANDASIKRALIIGMNDYITKPFIKDDIFTKIERWVNQPPQELSSTSLESNPQGSSSSFFPDSKRIQHEKDTTGNTQTPAPVMQSHSD